MKFPLTYLSLITLGAVDYPKPRIKIKLIDHCPKHGKECVAYRPHCLACGIGLLDGFCINHSCSKSYEGRQTSKGVRS